MSGVYVVYRDVLVEEYRGAGRYADWKTVHDFDVKGVTLSTKAVACWDHISIAPAVMVGDEVWVLWYTYRSGDSFGTETGQGEIIWVFTEEDVAQKALKVCEEQGRNRHDQFKFEDEDGETLYVGNPGRGDYFSRFQGAYLTECVVGQCPPPRYVEQYLEDPENPC